MPRTFHPQDKEQNAPSFYELWSNLLKYYHIFASRLLKRIRILNLKEMVALDISPDKIMVINEGKFVSQKD